MSRVILARGIRNSRWRGGSGLVDISRSHGHSTGSDLTPDMRCAEEDQKDASDEDDEQYSDARTADSTDNERKRKSAPLSVTTEEVRTNANDDLSPPTAAPSSSQVQTPSEEAVESSPDRNIQEDQDATVSNVIFTWLQNWSANPEGKVMFYWKGFLTMAVIYNCVVVIMRTAFSELRDENLFMWLDYLSDLVYLLDTYIESKTTYLQNGCVVTESRLMLENYLGKKHFTHDIVSVLPIQLVYTIVTVFLYIIGSDLVAGSIVGRFLTCYPPVLRLNRLVKCHTMSKFFQNTESRTNSPNRLRAFRLGLQLALVIHWIACLYYMLSEYEGHGTTEWTYPTGPGYDNFYKKYIICMYWSTMTLTTIGERPSPTTDVEYVFTGFTFMVGVFVFAAVVGNVGDVISNMNAARRDFQSRMDQIKFYLNHRDVPDHLQTRIKRWAEYTWDRTKAIDEQSVLQLLPDRLRTEVAIYVHLNVLKKVSIFAECEEGLLRELVLKLKPQIFSPGDYICRIGEIGREMFIINHGQVEILFPDSETNAMRRVAVMFPGNFFGEISLLKLDDGQNKRTADVRSVGFSELLCLSRRELMVALTEYPEAKRILEEYAKERYRQTKKQADETDESAEGSRRASSASPGSPMTSASQVFARVMRREGFSRLLQRKDTDLMAIKTAVEELKANKTAEVQENFVLMKRKIQDLEGALFERSVQLQEACAHIDYLKMANSRLSHSISRGSVCSNASTHSQDDIPSHFQHPDIPTDHPNDPQSTIGHAYRQFVPDPNQQTPHVKPDGMYTNSIPESAEEPMRNDFYNLKDLRRYSFKYYGHQAALASMDPSTPMASSDDEDGSESDMESVERKFDEIGKEDAFYLGQYDSDDWQRRFSLPKLQAQNDYFNRRHSQACSDYPGGLKQHPTPSSKSKHSNGARSQSLNTLPNTEMVSPWPLERKNLTLNLKPDKDDSDSQLQLGDLSQSSPLVQLGTPSPTPSNHDIQPSVQVQAGGDSNTLKPVNSFPGSESS